MTNIIGPDVSFYQDDDLTPQGINFIKMREQTEFVKVRAGQGGFRDPDFGLNWVKAKDGGLLRASYWFYDSRYTPESQAERWITGHGGDLGELPLWADFEENYNGPFEGWRNWKKFLEEVRRLAPTHEIGIYSAFFYWDDNAPPSGSADREWFHQFPLWIASYRSDAPVVPAPWSPDEWLFWQFETNEGNALGPLYGVESRGIDRNYFNGDSAAFHARFGGAPTPLPPPPDPAITTTHDGVQVAIVQRFGCKCVIHRFDLSKVRILVTPGPFQTVGAAVAKYGAQGGFNGGGWPDEYTPGQSSNEVWVSDGRILQSTAVDNRGYINVTKQPSAYPLVEIRENDALSPVLWNAWGFDRILGKNGQFNTDIGDRTTKDARTGAGITAADNLIILSAEGNDREKRGLSFPEMWSVLSEFGAVIAGNNDGGSSTTAINLALGSGNLVTMGEVYEQSFVKNQVLFFAEGGGSPDPTPPPPPPDGGNMDIYILITAARPRTVASLSTNDTDPNVPAGTSFSSDTVVQDVKDLSGPKMVKIMSAGTWFNKWVPFGMYDGKEYARLEGATIPPPPPSGDEYMILHRTDGSETRFIPDPNG